MQVVHHTCTPGQFCGLCAHNVRHGGAANHPTNLLRPPNLRRTVTATPPRKPLPLCTFRGDELNGFERESLGLDHRRNWHWCQHERKPLGDAVCGCRGCGPACPGYSAG